MELPTPNQCLDYFFQYKVPYHIKNHCLRVKEVAVFLAKKLAENSNVSINHNINVELVERLALFHDLFKVATIKDLKPFVHHPEDYSAEEIAMWKELRTQFSGMYEGEVAYAIFKDIFPEFALAVKRTADPKTKDKTWEERIVHYADWRVVQNQVVTLKQRLDDLKLRYTPRQSWDNYEELIEADEDKIFSNLNFLPEDLNLKIESEK